MRRASRSITIKWMRWSFLKSLNERERARKMNDNNNEDDVAKLSVIHFWIFSSLEWQRLFCDAEKHTVSRGVPVAQRKDEKKKNRRKLRQRKHRNGIRFDLMEISTENARAQNAANRIRSIQPSLPRVFALSALLSSSGALLLARSSNFSDFKNAKWKSFQQPNYGEFMVQLWILRNCERGKIPIASQNRTHWPESVCGIYRCAHCTVYTLAAHRFDEVNVLKRNDTT